MTTAPAKPPLRPLWAGGMSAADRQFGRQLRAETDSYALPPSQRAAFLEAAAEKAAGLPPGTYAKMVQAAQDGVKARFEATQAWLNQANGVSANPAPILAPAPVEDEEPASAPLFRRRRPAFRPD